MFVVSSGHGGVVASNLLYFDGMYYKLHGSDMFVTCKSHASHMEVTCLSHAGHTQVTWKSHAGHMDVLVPCSHYAHLSHSCACGFSCLLGSVCLWSLLPQPEAEDCMQGSQ